MTDVREVLLRLKRRMGRERGREVRGYNTEAASSAHKDRCWYQANIWGLAMSMLDDELQRNVKSLPPKAKRRAIKE
jgi:hypothetical protein